LAGSAPGDAHRVCEHAKLTIPRVACANEWAKVIRAANIKPE
jgi:hypothetical protein